MSDPLGTLFNQFVTERIYLHNVTEKTQVWYQTAWKAFCDSGAADPRTPTTLTKAHLQAFVSRLRQRDVRPRTVNTYLQALNAFGRWLRLEEHSDTLVRLPLLRTEKRVIETLAEGQIRQLLRFKPRTFPEWRIHALVCLLLDTGIRIDEALGLEAGRVDMDQLLLTVLGKGRKERQIPFSYELRKILFRFEQFRGRKGLTFPLLFAARTGTKWGQRNAHCEGEQQEQASVCQQ